MDGRNTLSGKVCGGGLMAGAEHCVFTSGRMKCLVCGMEETPMLVGCPVDYAVSIMDKFVDRHRDCKKGG